MSVNKLESGEFSFRTKNRQVDLLRFKSEKKSDILSPLTTADPRKRQTRDNRLWLFSFITVLVITSFLIWKIGKEDAEIANRAMQEIGAQRRPAYNSESYQEAASVMLSELQALGIKNAWVRFTDEQRLEVEIPTSVDRALVPQVIRILRSVSLKQLKLEPDLAVYFAKSPGSGKRTQTIIEGFAPNQ